MQPVDSHLKARFFPFFLKVDVHLLLDLVDDLLDARRVDAPVGDQPLQGQPRDLPAIGIVGRDQHRLRRVVHDEVDAGVQLERADVTSLAPDDPSLHVVGGQVDDGHRGLDGVVGGQALDGGGQHFANAGRQILLGPPLSRSLPLAAAATNWPGVRSIVAKASAKKVAQKVRRDQYPAPYAILELWKDFGGDVRKVPPDHPASMFRIFDSPRTEIA